MGNDLACRLPSISLLALDLPLPRAYLPHLHEYGLASLAAAARPDFLRPDLHYSTDYPPFKSDAAKGLGAYSSGSSSPVALAPPITVQTPIMTPIQGMTPVASIVTRDAEIIHTDKSAAATATTDHNQEHNLESSPSTPQSSTLLVHLMPPASTPASPKSPERNWKPRKKRQCPECGLYFSNLATHKSTHLKPTSRPHVCKLCQRGFARPNDLFRHFKCHWKEIGADNGQFRCPFKNGPRGDHCCHLLGIFSRCDTYKNHLKAIHFQYPGGTKKSQRNHVPGQCRLCHAQFRTVDEWIATHVDTHLCPYGTQ